MFLLQEYVVLMSRWYQLQQMSGLWLPHTVGWQCPTVRHVTDVTEVIRNVIETNKHIGHQQQGMKHYSSVNCCCLAYQGVPCACPLDQGICWGAPANLYEKMVSVPSQYEP